MYKSVLLIQIPDEIFLNAEERAKWQEALRPSFERLEGVTVALLPESARYSWHDMPRETIPGAFAAYVSGEPVIVPSSSV